MKPSLVSAMFDKQYFASWFAKQRDSWRAWTVVLKALFCESLNDEEMEIFRRHTQRSVLPRLVSELWIVAGRRAGKSLIAALIAVYLACFFDYRAVLAPGEVGTLMIIAPDRKQCRVILRYLKAFLKIVPSLKKLISHETKESIELSNSVVIEVHTASFTTVRGYTLIGVIVDEIAFLPSGDAAEPDMEILNALRRGMATVPGSLLICISSPYARKGALWEAYKEHFGKDDSSVLVWQADSKSMNPSLPQSVIDHAYEQDEVGASAEYGAQFRRDIESYASREAIDAAVVPGRVSLPPIPEVQYVGFVDPSGGSQDSFTLGIAHCENGKAILDVTIERIPPFSPESVVSEFADVLKLYHCLSVHGDRYGGEFPRELFRNRGIDYILSDKTKSDIYRELLPALNSSKVELLDIPRLKAQLGGLERRISRSGKDAIDHAPTGRDDLINAAAGALLRASQSVSWDGFITESASADMRRASSSYLPARRGNLRNLDLRIGNDSALRRAFPELFSNKR